ncbi:hypothetical protein ACR31S_04130 [Streptococcus iniae]
MLITKELNRYCLEHLAGYKAPKAYLVLEDFPRNAIGKIGKGQIQKWLTDYVKRHGQDII